MNCRELRAALAGPGGGRSDAALVHRAACAACDQEARAHELLRLGTILAASGPRSGFEARLRARISAEGPAPALSWADGISLVARPSLALATVALLVSLGWLGLSYSRTASADDLTLITGGDPLLAAVSIGGVDGIDAAESDVTDSGAAP
jgi:hypothetical protein